jgi:phospholipase C
VAALTIGVLAPVTAVMMVVLDGAEGRARPALPPGPRPATASAPDSRLPWLGLRRPTPDTPCGGAAGHAARVAHVIVLVLENHSFDQLIGPAGSPAAHQAPFLNALASRCGLATDYHSITHPSLPNYLAMTAGSTFGLTRDVKRAVSGASIFSELDAIRGSWGVYAEGMPYPCADKRTSPVGYTPHHNPVVAYANLAADCAARDHPLGSATAGPLAFALATGQLPSFVFVAPSLGHDMHTGSIAAGDRWLRRWVTSIWRSATYRRQSTVLFITVDEGTGGHIGKGEDCAAHPTDPSCHVPLVVVSRYVRPGTRSAAPLTHYSLLRTAAGLLGVPAPGHAAGAPGMRAIFGL